MHSKSERIVIIGGGSAGWLTTLLLSSRFPEKKFTVIDPIAIGAIGVGESVTGAVLNLVNDPSLGLNLSDFFRRADATMKLGIWFKDWQGAGTEYLAPIDNPKSYFEHAYPDAVEEFYAMAAADGVRLGKAQIHAHLMRANKTDYFRKEGKIHNQLAHASCHLDALKFADWLRRVCCSRSNVTHIDDSMTSFEQSADSGIITKIVTTAGVSVAGDFFVDCSGLRRLLLGKAFPSEWVDFSTHIRVDRAIPCETSFPEGKPMSVYTEALAMPNGWMWEIPTQSRIGRGYLYSSKYVNDEGAIQEMRDAGVDPGDNPRVIQFRPGKFAEQWQGNVCAIGLAGGFVEALESTTIHGMISQIKLLGDLFLPFYTHEAASVMASKFNRLVDVMYRDYVDFVSFHYHAGRSDTEFWRDYQKTKTITPSNQERMKMWQHSFPHREDFSPVHTTRVHLTSGMPLWMPMLCGMDLLNASHARQVIKGSKYINLAQENLKKYIGIRGFLDSHAISQEDAIGHLRGN